MITVVDTLDYLLTYNQTWLVYGLPVSWDILKVVFFTLAIVNEVLIEFEKKLQNRI